MKNLKWSCISVALWMLAISSSAYGQTPIPTKEVTLPGDDTPAISSLPEGTRLVWDDDYLSTITGDSSWFIVNRAGLDLLLDCEPKLVSANEDLRVCRESLAKKEEVETNFWRTKVGKKVKGWGAAGGAAVLILGGMALQHNLEN